MSAKGLGEFELIERIVAGARTKGADHHDDLIEGPGDDAAILEGPNGRAYLWTADLLEENVHFRRAWSSPEALGAKALAVNLSDIAAMGARPVAFLASVARPNDVDDLWLEAFFDGMHRLAQKSGAASAGGDLSRSEEAISIHVTLLGEAPTQRIRRRSGGRAGDGLFVSGRLGGAGAAVDWLLGAADPTSKPPVSLEPALAPQPELALGWALGGGADDPLAGAMIDLSDGLAGDLAHLCKASGVGAELEADRIPISPEVSAYWLSKGADPLIQALESGEDYRLLFSVPEARTEEIAQLPVGVFRIGSLTEEKGIRLRRVDGSTEPLAAKSWDHFAEA